MVSTKIKKLFLGKFRSRELWSSAQKNVARCYFKDELANESHIYGDKIRELKNKYPELMKNRSVPMLKQWLEGEKQKIKLGEGVVNGIIFYIIYK